MKIFFRVFCAVLVIALEACSPMYVPDTLGVPLHSNPGEVILSGSLGTSGIGGRASYALSSEWFVFGNAMYVQYNPDSDNSSQQVQFIETGAGLNLLHREVFRVDLAGGIGAGSLTSVNQSFTDQHFIRLALLPSIAWQGRWAVVGFGSRMAFVHAREYSSNGVFIEPALFLKFGSRNIKFVSQAGLSLPLNEAEIQFTYVPFQFNAGIEIEFPFRNQ